MPNQNMASEKSIKWLKTGGGELSLRGGRVIKPGEVFDAHLDEIPQGFRDVVRPVNPESIQETQEPPIDVPRPEYSLTVREPGLYDVIGPNGKVVNEKGLDKMDALELINELLQ